MANYYVDKLNGSDSNGGTSWADAFASITKALQNNGAGVEGDNVYINHGVYQENVSLSVGYNIIGIGKVIIDGLTTYGFNISLTMTGTSTIQNIEFYNCSEAITTPNSANTINYLLKNCIFRSNTVCLYLQFGNTFIEPENCLFIDNGTGIERKNIYKVTDYQFNTFINNTIAINYSLVSSSSSQSNIKNNIFKGNTTAIEIKDSQGTPGNITITNNCFNSNTTDVEVYTNPITNDNPINLDPVFLDETNEIFMLQSTSPCIQAADDGFSTVGAFEQGIVTTDFSAWTLTNCFINGNGEVELTNGQISGTVESPVFDLGNNQAKINNILFNTVEDESYVSGSRSVVDTDNTDVIRQFEYRSDNDQVTLAGKAYSTATHNESLNILNRYLQVKFTLRTDGF